MKKILKITSILGVATLVRIFAGAIRAKFLAWQIGPAGMGLIGQALMYSVFTIQLCSLNMAMGITKSISENLARKNEGRIPVIVNTAATLQFIASILFIIVVLPFSRPLTKFIFSDYRYWPYLVGITLVTPFAVYIVGMADPVFYGFRKIAEYTRFMVLYTFIGLALLFPLVYFYKTGGMLVQILLVSIIGFLLSYYFIRTRIRLRPRLDFNIFKDKDSRGCVYDLFQYGLISFIPGSINMFVVLYLRGLLMRQYGVDAGGYYQVAYAVSAYYLPFVTNAIWGHFYPEMCALKDNDHVNREMNQFIRFVLFAATAIAAGSIIFRRYIILILFSQEFMKAYNLLAIQAIGDVFFILFCIFSTSLMARKKFPPIIFISTIGYNAVLVSGYILLNALTGCAYQSLNLAIAVTNIALVIIYLIYYRFDTAFMLNRGNVSLLIKSAFFLALVYMIPDANPLYSIVKLFIAGVWLGISVTGREARGFAEMLLPFLNPLRRNPRPSDRG